MEESAAVVWHRDFNLKDVPKSNQVVGRSLILKIDLIIFFLNQKANNNIIILRYIFPSDFDMAVSEWKQRWALPITMPRAGNGNSITISQKYGRIYLVHQAGLEKQCMVKVESYDGESGFLLGSTKIPKQFAWRLMGIAAMDHRQKVYLDLLPAAGESEPSAQLIDYFTNDLETASAFCPGMREAPEFLTDNSFAWDLSQKSLVFYSSAADGLNIVPESHVVRGFTPNQSYVVKSALPGGEQPLVEAVALCADGAGRIFVAELSGRISVYSKCGDPLGTLEFPLDTPICGLGSIRAQGWLIVATESQMYSFDVSSVYPPA